MNGIHDEVMKATAASVDVVNGINNYFIIVKATTEAARIPFMVLLTYMGGHVVPL
jgi:hypothetical protein